MAALVRQLTQSIALYTVHVDRPPPSCCSSHLAGYSWRVRGCPEAETSARRETETSARPEAGADAVSGISVCGTLQTPRSEPLTWAS